MNELNNVNDPEKLSNSQTYNIQNEDTEVKP